MLRTLNAKQHAALDRLDGREPDAVVVGWHEPYNSPLVRVPGKPRLQAVHPETGYFNGIDTDVAPPPHPDMR